MSIIDILHFDSVRPRKMTWQAWLTDWLDIKHSFTRFLRSLSLFEAAAEARKGKRKKREREKKWYLPFLWKQKWMSFMPGIFKLLLLLLHNRCVVHSRVSLTELSKVESKWAKRCQGLIPPPPSFEPEAGVCSMCSYHFPASHTMYVIFRGKLWRFRQKSWVKCSSSSSFSPIENGLLFMSTERTGQLQKSQKNGRFLI